MTVRPRPRVTNVPDYQPYLDASAAHNVSITAEQQAAAALATAEAELAAAQASYDAAAADFAAAKAQTDADLTTLQATHDTYRP